MFKLIGSLFGFIFKLVLIAAAVVGIGNWLGWDGRSISRSLNENLAAIERASWVRKAEGWVGLASEDARPGARRHHLGHARGNASTHRAATAAGGSNYGMQDSLESESAADSRSEEQVSPTERQKLRTLIQELNTSRKASAGG